MQHTAERHRHVVKPALLSEHPRKMVVVVEANRGDHARPLSHELAEVGKVANLARTVGVIVGLHAPPRGTIADGLGSIADALKADRGHHHGLAVRVGAAVRHLLVGTPEILKHGDQDSVVAPREVSHSASRARPVKAGARRHLGAVNVDVRAVVRAGAHAVLTGREHLEGTIVGHGGAPKVCKAGDALEVGSAELFDSRDNHRLLGA
mmetsp:Transcript_30836/g.74420  ORF Transcript_30836/g.74420 Transcript_30836/m.74420 type:complete len:207 (-) Transcript_30836:703-1323(-)